MQLMKTSATFDKLLSQSFSLKEIGTMFPNKFFLSCVPKKPEAPNIIIFFNKLQFI